METTRATVFIKLRGVYLCKSFGMSVVAGNKHHGLEELRPVLRIVGPSRGRA